MYNRRIKTRKSIRWHEPRSALAGLEGPEVLHRQEQQAPHRVRPHSLPLRPGRSDSLALPQLRPGAADDEARVLHRALRAVPDDRHRGRRRRARPVSRVQRHDDGGDHRQHHGRQEREHLDRHRGRAGHRRTHRADERPAHLLREASPAGRDPRYVADHPGDDKRLHGGQEHHRQAVAHPPDHRREIGRGLPEHPLHPPRGGAAR